ncbi:IS3 family transposase [Streptomyces spectabilis]|uniref:IS3 family transposase n=1 Tax=Streptomyces spectabilis TaxID=68270 RepID=UPI0028937B66|nr:IS3 family transposase [Streptomyces spectabilis]
MCRSRHSTPRRRRPKSARRQRDEQLIDHIRRIHGASGEIYGARRIHRQLRREGIIAARCTVERLMREDGLEGVIRGQRRRTTIPEPSVPRPPDLVSRRFTAIRPNQLWVADLTYIRTRAGWVYVAFVLDMYSRMIVGWQLATLIHHSDRGSQYVSIPYGERLIESGATASVGSVADSYDNAMAEALNGSFKTELIEHQGPWRDADQVERAVVQWIGNPRQPRTPPETIQTGRYETRGSSAP